MIQAIVELDEFFQRRGKLFQTLQKLALELRSSQIDYAVVGGMALVFHGYVRATQDINVLLTPEGLKTFQREFVGRGFVPAFSGAKRMFRDAENGVVVEFLVTGEFPGDRRPKAICFPNPVVAAIERDGIWIIRLNALIELKLASGLSSSDRLKDLGDVQELIRTLKLSRSLAIELDESVRDGFLQLWDGIERAGRDRLNFER